MTGCLGTRAACCSLLVALVAAVAVGCGSTDDAGAGIGDVDATTVTDAADTTADSRTPATGGTEPEGFSTVAAIITDADGATCEVCLWLADSAEERSRGLMGVTSLGDAAGMAFVFPEPTSGSFYMFQTPTPLSIAWFGADGTFVATSDMVPCLDTPAGECLRYSPDAEYLAAVEMFAGELSTVGIGPGAHLELVEGSEADRCPLATDL